MFQTGSDCEVILHMYEEYGPGLVNYLEGMFAFVLYDVQQDRYIAARDPIGIVTLYQGWSTDGSVWFASEVKSLFEDCAEKLVSFEPGTLYDSRLGKASRWYRPIWWDETWQPTPSRGFDPENPKPIASFEASTLKKLKLALERSIESHLMSEVPYGVLLSGGLDSSLIASIASRISAKLAREELKKLEDDMPVSPGINSQHSTMWSSRLHSFSIGLPGSPDLVAARRVAKYIGTKHHEFTFTIQEGIDAVRDVIHHLETYDVTTIRASTPMFLMSRKIKATGVKMVLSGEGSDELFGGYLYFHQAPSAADLHVETVKRVKLLHTSDCLRANKSTMAWGLEARVPFLDTKFLDVAMTLPPEYKHPGLTPRKIEKELVRQAFDVSEDDGFGHVRPFLPDDILWRQKEQFSDGVGYSWIDMLKQYTTAHVSDDQWAEREHRFPYNTPSTREAFFYRQVFEEFFCPGGGEKNRAVLETVVKWVPRKDWGCPEDPSGRSQKVHAESYTKAK